MQEPTGTIGNPPTVMNLLQPLDIYLNLWINNRNHRNLSEPSRTLKGLSQLYPKMTGTCHIMQEHSGTFRKASELLKAEGSFRNPSKLFCTF